jgi:hypothetical protein
MTDLDLDTIRKALKGGVYSGSRWDAAENDWIPVAHDVAALVAALAEWQDPGPFRSFKEAAEEHKARADRAEAALAEAQEREQQIRADAWQEGSVHGAARLANLQHANPYRTVRNGPLDGDT